MSHGIPELADGAEVDLAGLSVDGDRYVVGRDTLVDADPGVEALDRGQAAVEARGIVHRDFKPDNVLLGHDGRVRVMLRGQVSPLADRSRRGQHRWCSSRPVGVALLWLHEQVMVAWILACRACRTPLSVPLTELELDAAPVQLVDGRDALPRGCMWRARSGFAEFGQLGVGDLLCCRRDLPGVQDGGGPIGCCGPSGLGGPNLRCVCGSDIATEFGDCWQPHIVCVQTKRVICEPATPEVAVHVYPPEDFHAGTHRSAWAFAGWLHELLGAQEWYGLELDALIREWTARSPTPIVIVWLDVQREHTAGVPVHEWLAQSSGTAITVVPMSAP